MAALSELPAQKDLSVMARSSKALDDRIRAKWAKDLPKGFQSSFTMSVDDGATTTVRSLAATISSVRGCSAAIDSINARARARAWPMYAMSGILACGSPG